jgi:hypothetical protein
MMRGLVAVCAALSVGCGGASSYTPQEPGRIHFVRTASGRALEKDGKLYSASGFWGESREAVAGDPDAEAHARTYVWQTRSTGPLVLLALGLLLPAGVLMTGEPDHTGQRVAAIGLASAGMTALVFSFFIPQLARPHLYHAINVYNDHVGSKQRGEPPLGERDRVQPVGLPPARP